MSDWELDEGQWEQEKPGSWFEELGKSLGQYGKGTQEGGMQALGDIGASVGNFPADIYEYFSGRKPYHIPHPQITSQPAQSIEQNIGRSVGENLAPFALPFGSGRLAASRFSGLLPKLLAGSSAGALSGAAQQEGMRGLGALTGALTGGATGVSPWVSKLYKDIKPENIKRSVLGAEKKFEGLSRKNFESVFDEAKKTAAHKYLTPQKADTRLLKKSGQDVEALERYNANPTIQNAHDAQSDLAKIASGINPRASSVDRRIKKEATDASKELREKISSAFNKSGHPELAARYHQSREFHKQHVIPYHESQAIKALKKGKLRTEKFPEKLLKEESFIAQKGEEHPELIMREKIGKAFNSKVGQTATGAALGVVGGLLPWEIRKNL